jgi:hypothetical protein
MAGRRVRQQIQRRLGDAFEARRASARRSSPGADRTAGKLEQVGQRIGRHRNSTRQRGGRLDGRRGRARRRGCPSMRISPALRDAGSARERVARALRARARTSSDAVPAAALVVAARADR